MSEIVHTERCTSGRGPCDCEFRAETKKPTPLEMLEELVANRDRSLREKFPWAAIGEGSYGGMQAIRWDELTDLRIGNYCSFSFDVKVLLGGEHRMDWTTTFPFSDLWERPEFIGHPMTRGDVVIGNDVWVGAEAMITSGTTIGDGAVIGARSLVNGVVPPYAIFAGSPARFIRFRFDAETIDRLLKLKWWDWPRSKIEQFLPLMLNTHVKTFLDEAERAS